MFLHSEELTTHLYHEQIEVITREDDTIILAAIDAAVEEAKGYLGSYDTARIFSAQGNKRNALLLLHVKDIAVWHFITLANPACDIELRKFRYERATAYLKAIQRGEISPSLPQPDENGDGKPDTAGVYIHGSNPKRGQHF